MKRKEFLMSLGLIGIAPKLLSKDLQPELPESKEEFNSSVVTLTMYQIGELNKILDKDLVWIMKPSNNNDGTYIPVAEGYVNSRTTIMNSFAKVEVVVLRQMSKFSDGDSLVLYHVESLGSAGYYHRRLSIESIKG